MENISFCIILTFLGKFLNIGNFKYYNIKLKVVGKANAAHVIFRASSLSSWHESEHPRVRENRPKNDPCAAVNVPEGSELYIYFYACVNAGPF